MFAVYLSDRRDLLVLKKGRPIPPIGVSAKWRKRKMAIRVSDKIGSAIQAQGYYVRKLIQLDWGRSGRRGSGPRSFSFHLIKDIVDQPLTPAPGSALRGVTIVDIVRILRSLIPRKTFTQSVGQSTTALNRFSVRAWRPLEEPKRRRRLFAYLCPRQSEMSARFRRQHQRANSDSPQAGHLGTISAPSGLARNRSR